MAAFPKTVPANKQVFIHTKAIAQNNAEVQPEVRGGLPPVPQPVNTVYVWVTVHGNLSVYPNVSYAADPADPKGIFVQNTVPPSGDFQVDTHTAYRGSSNAAVPAQDSAVLTLQADPTAAKTLQITGVDDPVDVPSPPPGP